MENKKKLDNLSEEQIDGTTVKGGTGKMRPTPVGGAPGVPGAPSHSPENHLPGQLPDASEPDPTNPTPHPAHPPHNP